MYHSISRKRGLVLLYRLLLGSKDNTFASILTSKFNQFNRV